jgi:hypothetical protein
MAADVPEPSVAKEVVAVGSKLGPQASAPREKYRQLMRVEALSRTASCYVLYVE